MSLGQLPKIAAVSLVVALSVSGCALPEVQLGHWDYGAYQEREAEKLRVQAAYDQRRAYLASRRSNHSEPSIFRCITGRTGQEIMISNGEWYYRGVNGNGSWNSGACNTDQNNGASNTSILCTISPGYSERSGVITTNSGQVMTFRETLDPDSGRFTYRATGVGPGASSPGSRETTCSKSPLR